MHLHVSIALLLSLLTGGFSLECYQCFNQQEFPCNQTTKCFIKAGRCLQSRRVHYDTGAKEYAHAEAKCARPDDCESWSISMTPFRVEKVAECCDTDLCNKTPAPVLNSQPNGKKCYSCDRENCSQTVNCWGNENYCFTANNQIPAPTVTVKGCASEFACGTSGRVFGPGVDISCCEGNLCNSAEKITQRFLFLCCSLFYFLLN